VIIKLNKMLLIRMLTVLKYNRRWQLCQIIPEEFLQRKWIELLKGENRWVKN